MRTLTFIAAGIVLFAVIYLVARTLAPGGASAMALKIFLPVWFIIAVINLMIGVNTAGYTVMEELPILLVIFGIPAVIALAVRWRETKA